MGWLAEGGWRFPALAPFPPDPLRKFRPGPIYAAARIDGQPQQHQVPEAPGVALSQWNRLQERRPIRVYQVQVPLTTVLVNLIVDTSDVAKESVSVLDAYTTQMGSTCRALRKWRYGACFYGAEKHQEEFWEIAVDQYCMLHRLSPEAWPTEETFRVIEFRSYSDPLAYLKGLTQRRQLASLIQ